MSARREERETAVGAEDRRRKHGGQLIVRLLAVLRTGRAYKVGNQVFRQQLDALFETLGALFEESEEVVLVMLDSDLFVNGVRLPMKSRDFRHFETLMREFTRRRIAGIRFTSEVRADELERFFDLFLRPHEFTGTPLLEACLAAGLDHVLPAVHASTSDLGDFGLTAGSGGDEPGEPGDSDAESEGGGWGDGSGSGIGGGDAGELVDGTRAGVRGGARKSYAIALQGAQSLLTTTSLQEGTELRHAKRVVQPLVDSAFKSEPVVVGLSTLGHHDEYTYAHAVNVCMVSVTMGHALDLDRRALADLAVAALLHDVGKAAVGPKILHPLEQFTEEERALAERHPAEGARLIARSTVLNGTTLRSMRVALEHHLTADGRGYPAGESVARASLLSRLVGVADCYVSLMTHRSPRGLDVTPYEALGLMLGPLARRFNPALLWALVQAVGFYPPGQVVELDDGSIALVLAPQPGDFHRPHVRVIVRPDGSRVPAEEPLEFRPLPPERRVQRALSAYEYPAFERAKHPIEATGAEETPPGDSEDDAHAA